jgi:hypothetical protein
MILDALTHDWAGPMSWLEQLALQVEPSQLYVDRLARALDMLAHIEVERDPITTRPLSWEVLPPTLVESSTGAYFLCGQRSLRIESALAAAASEAGVVIERTAQGLDAPQRILLMTNSQAEAHEVANAVGRDAGVNIDVLGDASRRMVSILPALSSVIEFLPRQAMVGGRSIRRWSSDHAQWQQAGDASRPGAYHLRTPAPLYCIRDELDIQMGTMRRVDARLAKHAVATFENRCLLGYDSTEQVLYTPLGADLPGLFGRVAVLCSGLLPSQDERQRTTSYRQVPQEIAEQLAYLMSERAG